MAKLKMPLVSFGASGSLGKEIVFFPWKGLNCVRQWVKPTNPNTTAQSTQRARMTAAVAAFHAAPYTASDITAFARWAGAVGQTMTGFNKMVKTHIIEAILGNTWERLRNGLSANPGTNDFEVTVQKAGGGNAVTCHYGVRKTYFPDSEVMDDVGGATWGKTLSGLVASTAYYFYFSVGTSASDYARTGIYLQRTTA